jgi:ubiquinol-cytochrome c reductase cytochrome c subunit
MSSPVRPVVAAGLVVAALVLWAAPWSSATGALDDPGTPAPSADDAATRFAQDCAICHGPRGEGSFQGPDITRSGTAAVDFMLRTGRMPLRLEDAHRAEAPAGPPAYSEAMIEALVAYSAAFVQGPAAPGPVDTSGADLAAGAQRYRASCAACHQAAGQGGVLAYGTDVPDLTGSTPVEVIEAMRVGPGSMPVFPATAVGDDEAVDVAAYIGSLHDPDDRGGFDLWHLGPVPEGLVAWTIGIGSMLLWCRWLGSRDRLSTD